MIMIKVKCLLIRFRMSPIPWTEFSVRILIILVMTLSSSTGIAYASDLSDATCRERETPSTTPPSTTTFKKYPENTKMYRGETIFSVIGRYKTRYRSSYEYIVYQNLLSLPWQRLRFPSVRITDEIFQAQGMEVQRRWCSTDDTDVHRRPGET